MKKDITVFSILVLIGALSRLVPHVWNFTALGAVALTAGVLIDRKALGLMAPMLALLISDAVLGFYGSMLFIYLGYASVTVASRYLGQKNDLRHTLSRVLLGSLLFFVISNFGVWFEGALYPKTFEGFLLCYQMAIPFFKNELLSNLLLTPALLYIFSRTFKNDSVRVNHVA